MVISVKEVQKLHFRHFVYGKDRVRALAVNDVHLWTILLSGLNEMEKYEGLLSNKDKRESNLIGSERNRRLFVAGRGVLRTLLGEYIHVRPQNVEIEIDIRGHQKLSESVNNDALSFNLTHSGNIILCAFARQVSLGVDVQYAYKVPVCADAVLSRDEIRLIAQTPESLQTEMFLRIWTLKEAFLKATSRGLEAIDSVSVVRGWNSSTLTIETRGTQAFREFELFTFIPGLNYFATVVAGW